MPRPLRWTHLIPGLVALACVAGVVLSILLFARVGAAGGTQMRIYTAVPAARGIMRGSEVWLYGKPIGTVREVRFAPPSMPVEHRLIVALDVATRFRSHLRQDADARVQRGGSFVGAPVIHLTSGSPTARVIRAGDTLRGHGRADMEGMSEALSAAGRDLPAILQNVRMIGTQLRATSGTIGAFYAREGGVELDALQAGGARVASRFRRRDGSLGRSLDERAGLAARARALLASVDSVREFAGSPQGVYGRFRRDSTLALAIGALRDDLSIVRALMDSTNGSAGRLMHDRALVLELARADSAMQRLLDDIKRRPLRYLQLF